MTEEQAIGVFFQARDELRAFLTFYFVVIAALLGWLITHKELEFRFRSFLAIAFALHFTINGVGIWYSFRIIEAAQLDLAIKSPSHIVNEIKVLFFSWPLVLGFHFVVDVLMLVLIFWDQIPRAWNRMKRRSP